MGDPTLLIIIAAVMFAALGGITLVSTIWAYKPFQDFSAYMLCVF